eukprot:354784-Chlamydomonas_euryale.AAC.5
MSASPKSGASQLCLAHSHARPPPTPPLQPPHPPTPPLQRPLPPTRSLTRPLSPQHYFSHAVPVPNATPREPCSLPCPPQTT